MTHQFEHTGQPFPCCPWCGLLDEDIFKARKRLMCGGSWVEFHHECPGCKARYEVQFFPSKQAGFNTGFRECDRDAETLADPQNTADPVEGIDIPSPVKSSDVLEPREFDRVRAIELAAWAIAHHSNDADRYGLYWGSGMAAVDDMPDILKDTAKTSMSEPLSVSTPGDDSAPAVEGTQLADDTSGAARIYQERRRQVWDEGWTAEHDDAHGRGVLAAAAVCYIQHATGTPYRDNIEAYRSAPPPDGWPWDAVWWKPKQPQRDLVRAGALLAGEIDVIDRDIIRRAAGTE